MSATDEARRIMHICNACRYCEGFCAVFPAMELRTTFSDGDLRYLANLCHNCRGCYYACQYAPPHEFGVNVPRTLEEVRQESYRSAAWPPGLTGLFRRNGWFVAAITTASVLVIVSLTAIVRGGDLLMTHSGPGAFYRVVSYEAMVYPALLAGAYAMVAVALGAMRFWRQTAAPPLTSIRVGDWWCAMRDAMRLTYLGGGGHGCNYPSDRFSTSRRRLHHAVFYGFLLDLASTSVAAVYHHGLGRDAPYPVLSWPVVLGTAGGILLLIGTGGLLALKRRADRAPAFPGARGMDVAFLWLLFATSLTGLLVLIFRSTPAMGVLLAIHLGAVAGFFLTIPYAKLVHAVYRLLALTRYAREQT